MLLHIACIHYALPDHGSCDWSCNALFKLSHAPSQIPTAVELDSEMSTALQQHSMQGSVFAHVACVIELLAIQLSKQTCHASIC